MKTIIIEDEQLAASRLESQIKFFDPTIEVVAKLESVKESVEWFKNNSHPDLLFLDIHLEDGLSFTIFDKVKVNIPIIFTTAYDEYAIKAFKLKSIDYLLKPIVQKDLNNAIIKFREMAGHKQQVVDLSELYKLMQVKNKQFRDRFSVSVGEKLKTIEVKNIAYFFSTSGITFVVMKTKNQYSLDISLDKLLTELNPKDFFRINRQYLIHHDAIANVFVYPKSRLQIDLAPQTQDSIYVSLDKVSEFKRWFDGELVSMP
jgi:DNA-binding LytR/AlgR family response regulator